MDNFKSLKTWVDASYGMNHDIRGHFGAVMGIGKGIIHHNQLNKTEYEELHRDRIGRSQ